MVATQPGWSEVIVLRFLCCMNAHPFQSQQLVRTCTRQDYTSIKCVPSSGDAPFIVRNTTTTSECARCMTGPSPLYHFSAEAPRYWDFPCGGLVLLLKAEEPYRIMVRRPSTEPSARTAVFPTPSRRPPVLRPLALFGYPATVIRAQIRLISLTYRPGPHRHAIIVLNSYCQ